MSVCVCLSVSGVRCSQSLCPPGKIALDLVPSSVMNGPAHKKNPVKQIPASEFMVLLACSTVITLIVLRTYNLMEIP